MQWTQVDDLGEDDYKEEEIEVVNPEPNEKRNLNEDVISKNENSQQPNPE